jgi:hypothetical protein
LFRIDVGSEMYGLNTTCYIRIPFNIPAGELGDSSRLVLKVRYDDGFIAYLNGTEVARKNFAGQPAWNSAADAQNSDSAAVSFEEFDITAHLGRLRQGPNLLAVQALNTGTGSTIFSWASIASSDRPPAASPAACHDSRTVLPADCLIARALA